MEDAAIKHNFPEFNKVSKRTIQSYSIFSYEDRNGIIHLAINKGRLVQQPIATFFNMRDVRLYMENICSKYNLCPKYCHLQEAVWECSHYNITDCKGICRDEETSNEYNKRVHKAIYEVSENKQDIILKEKGRNSNEEAFIWIKENVYLGYGFIDKQEHISHQDDLQYYLIKQKDNIDIQKILKHKILDI
jgi:DNA polymerase-3 subunit epsilon